MAQAMHRKRTSYYGASNKRAIFIRSLLAVAAASLLTVSAVAQAPPPQPTPIPPPNSTLFISAAKPFAVPHGGRVTHPWPNLPVRHPTQKSVAQAIVRPAIKAALVNPATGCAQQTLPAPLLTLVTSLKCDPDLIFEYVYDNIEYEPTYGSNRGALGTYLDRHGNDSDQSVLLVTLLNAAGYSSATGYYNTALALTGTQIANWFGVPNDAASIAGLLALGGIPYSNIVCSPNPTCSVGESIVSISVQHFSVGLQLGGTWYQFDPSFKQHTIVAGVSGLASILGYNRAQFLNDIGGVAGPNVTASLNRTNLRNDLATYANNLVSYINKNNRTATVNSIIGGQTIQPLVGSPIRIAAGSAPTSSYPTSCPNETPTNVDCRASVTILMPGASAPSPVTMHTDEVYAHRITIFSVPSGSQYVAKLLVDGNAPSCVSSGCINVGSPSNAGTAWSLTTAAILPNTSAAPSGCTTYVGTVCLTMTIGAGTGNYLVALGVGRVGRASAEYHRQLLSSSKAAGMAATSEQVLGESLAVTADNWMAQVSSAEDLLEPIQQVASTYTLALGIAGQANIQSSGYAGPYVDLPMNRFGTQPWSSTGPTVTLAGYTYPASFVANTASTINILSSLETGVLLQSQSVVPSMIAASSAMLVDANMNPSYSGSTDITYLADGTTTAGVKYFQNSIYLGLSGYSSADLLRISNAISPNGVTPGGYQILLPKKGNLTATHWTGAGYFMLYPQSGSIAWNAVITGGMSGGFSGQNVADPSIGTVDAFQFGATDFPQVNLSAIPAQFDPTRAEPVDAVTGAYTYTHDDLVTGSGSFPYTLTFSRSYTSANGTPYTTQTSDIGMGSGWMHNYDVSAQPASDPYVGLGAGNTSALSAASAIAAAYVESDLTASAPTPRYQTVAIMTAHWLVDQLVNNVTLVTLPQTTEEFAALPHNDTATTISFNAPSASSDRLTQTGTGQYLYQLKDGTAYNFGGTAPTGDLSTISFPFGVTVNLTYSSGVLTGVSNNLGRSLSLSYTHNDVTGVADDTGRSVSYGYSAVNGTQELTSFTDALTQTTAFRYDTAGTYDTQGHLTQILYPANPSVPFVSNGYDALGRVAFQLDANGNQSNFYFANTRSEIVDPLGRRHVTYQTGLGRVTLDASVLSSSVGDIFNDTVQQNNLVNVTTNTYDGLDRLLSTTAPEGDSVAYTYATDINIWANNIASVTRTPKPGSSLTPITASITYDPLWNKPAKVTDGLGLVSLRTYDPSTRNLLQSVADYAVTGNHFNAKTTYTYNTVGQPLTVADPKASVTQNAYDTHGNLTKVTRDLGGLNQVTGLSYDSLGNLTIVTDPSNNATVNAFDALRRLHTTTVGTTGGTLVTTYSYDANDNRLQTQQAAAGTTLRTTSATYTPANKPVTQTDANGNVTKLTYDIAEQLVTSTDPYGYITSFVYDALGRKISTSNSSVPTGPLEQVAYTPDGVQASLTDANNNTTNFTYDGFNRLSITTYPTPSGGSSTTEKYAYDADDNVLSRITRKNDTISFSYDTLNRLCSKAIATTPTSCTATSSPNATVWYAYDADNHAAGLTDNSAAIVAPSGTSGSYATSTTYSTLNEPQMVTWNPAPAQTTPSPSSVTVNNTYDVRNQRVGQTLTDGSWLSYPSGTSSIAYSSNALNQYAMIGSVTPLYDADGNLTYDGTFTYSYDAENRLISIYNGATQVAAYAYDAQGRRKTKTVGTSKTVYITDADDREVLEYNGTSGAQQAWYAYGQGSNDVLNAMNLVSGTRTSMVPDSQGSIAGFLDSSTGALTKIGYQTYGEHPSLSTGSFNYTAQRYDPETSGSASEPSGLYYYRSRMYSPTLGRFLQPDTIGYQAGSNLYEYVRGDPLNQLDPFGEAALQLNAGLSMYLGMGNRAGLGIPYLGNIHGGYFAASAAGTSFLNFSNGEQGNGGSATFGAGVNGYSLWGGDFSTTTAPVESGATNWELGANVGWGHLVTFSWTANSQADLNGTFTTYEVDLGVLSLSYSKGYNAAGDYEGEVSFGPTAGIGFAKYETDTFGTGSTFSLPASVWGNEDLPVSEGTDSLNLNEQK